MDQESKNYKLTRVRLEELVFPILCEHPEESDLIFQPRLKGVFIGDTNKPEWEDKIIVLFDICAPKKFKDFFNKSKYKYKNYYENIDGKYYEILAFTIPPLHKKAINNLLNNQIEGVSRAYQYHIEQMTALSPGYYPWDTNGRNRPFIKEYLQLDLNGVNKKGTQNSVPFSVHTNDATTSLD